jgi:hypothetical protein
MQAALACLRYLKSQREADPPINGYTASRKAPSSFVGAWYDKKGDQINGVPPGWCEEAVLHVIIDYDADIEESRVVRVLGELHEKLKTLYADFGRPQKAFWITIQQLVQIVPCIETIGRDVRRPNISAVS